VRQLGDGGEQFAGVVVFGLLEDLLGGADFDELAGAHDSDARGHLGHDGLAVGNEDIGKREFELEFLQHEEDSSADGNVQGGDGFVGHDQLGLENQGAGDASPLTRAPGGSNPISASESIVFPLPDSPTSPSDSPAPMRNDTSFTGRTHPAGVGNSTISLRTSNNGIG